MGFTVTVTRHVDVIDVGFRRKGQMLSHTYAFTRDEARTLRDAITSELHADPKERGGEL
jgi:hypothetical protein